MTLATRGMGSANLIPTAGLGNYGVLVTPPEGGGGGGFLQLGKIIKRDIFSREYKEKEKEITPRQAIEALPKELVKDIVKRVKRELGILAPEARKQIKARAQKQIEAMRLVRIEHLNEEALALILIAIAESD